MEQVITNKVAVITGAAKGINFAIAEKILKEGGKHVILLDIISDKGNEAANTLNTKYGGGKAEFIKTDVTKDLDETFQAIIDKYKTVDILVNGAGIANESDIRKMVEINTIALIEWSRKFFRHMRRDKGGIGGTILNISSVYGYKVDPFFPVYKATKFAVMGFSKTVGHVVNYKVTGVRVVALCPGYTKTDMVLEAKPDDEFWIRERAEDREKQTSEDVAKAAIEVISKVPTGTAWKIIGAKPIEQV